jgi:hypothetical protein
MLQVKQSNVQGAKFKVEGEKNRQTIPSGISYFEH